MMKKQINQAVGALVLAGAIAVTGMATPLPVNASAQPPKSGSAVIKEPLPANIQASLKKFQEVEPSLKQFAIDGYSKQPKTNDGQIRGVWTVGLLYEFNSGKDKAHAELQFDSTTGTLLHYICRGFPAAKAKSQNQSFYKQKTSAVIKQLLGDEYVRQFEKAGEFSITEPAYNKVKRQVGQTYLNYKGEQFHIQIDADGRLEDFHRVPLKQMKKAGR